MTTTHRNATSTPWGAPNHVERISDTIAFYSTPSHGGFYVADVSLALIPQSWRDYAKRWSGSENWYEEDCAWAAVVVCFPGHFDCATQLRAQRFAREFLPAK